MPSIPTRDFFISAIIFIFALISVVTLKSIAPELATEQLIFWLIGLGVFFWFSKININTLIKYRSFFYWGVIILLMLTFVSNDLTRGAARWIKIGTLFSIQPSQLAIPVVGLNAAYFASKNKLNKLKNIGRFLGILSLPAFLILVEPDLGTTILFLLSLGAILFISEIDSKYLLGILITGLLSVIFAWLVVLKPYQKDRITSFMNAQKQEQENSNYNSYQAQIAVGSGGLYGKGLGHGSQSHLRFLPERQTDFIFASFAEEWGFLGSGILLFLYFSLNFYLLRYILKIKDKFKSYYLLITVTMISLQTFVNIGMNIGLLPITGVTLPLMSYGGSSLVSICLMLGIAQNIIGGYQKRIVMEVR